MEESTKCFALGALAALLGDAARLADVPSCLVGLYLTAAMFLGAFWTAQEAECPS